MNTDTNKQMIEALSALSATCVAFYRALQSAKLPANLCEQLTVILLRFMMEKAAGSSTPAMLIPFQTNDRKAG